MKKAFSLVEPSMQKACPVPAKAGIHQRGFSLVELSIVLVILGLLAGGILAGQSLIRAAELRSVVTDFDKYMGAVKNFRDKYQSLPGDMSDATDIWGAAHATPATCRTTASTSQATCNGDGNGRVIDSASGYESFRFWQHLANAGLIEGNYSGISEGVNSYSSTRTNSPQGKISNSLWFVWDWGTLTAQTAMFDAKYNNFFHFGGYSVNAHPIASILKPEEMWSIDTKIDDGKPGQGRMVVYAAGGLSTCTTTVGNNAATTNADYLLTGTSQTCSILFRDLF